MSIQPQPIYGNQYFKEVQNVASTNFQRIHADQLVTSHLQVGVDTKVAGDLKQYTVKCYAPTALSTLLTSAAVTLVKQAGIETATAANAFVLPAGAVLTGLVLKGSSLTSSGSATIGVETNTTLNNVSGTSILATAPAYADVNLGVNPALVDDQVASASALYLNVQPGTAALTAGSLVAYVSYDIPLSN
jgi:hypothetical protein